MASLEQLIRIFGSEDRIPDYLLDGLRLQEEAAERREQELRDHEAKLEAEFEAKRALRQPPARVWLVPVGSLGMEVHWEPPATADELPPTGYIVSGDSDSSQLLHPDTRSQFLRLWKPGNRIGVTTDYSAHQITTLEEHFTRWADQPEQPDETPTEALGERPELPDSGFSGDPWSDWPDDIIV